MNSTECGWTVSRSKYTNAVLYAAGHSWKLQSLRGTNRNQRVEHVRCANCGEERTRVWLDLPKEKRPDREYRTRRRGSRISFAA